MKTEELVPLTNGLSVMACGHTLVCDRARITPVRDDALDLKMWIVGTDFVPRMRLPVDRIAASTADEMADLVRHVVRCAVTGQGARAGRTTGRPSRR